MSGAPCQAASPLFSNLIPYCDRRVQNLNARRNRVALVIHCQSPLRLRHTFPSQLRSKMTTQAVEKPTEPDVERISRAWRAFMAYRGLSLQVFDSQMHSFERLSEVDRSLVSTLPIRLSHAAEAVEHNADVIERIAELAGIDSLFEPDEISPEQLAQTVADFPDVVDGLLAIVRDWSSAGEKDRMLSYDPIIHALDEAVDDAITSGAVPDRKSFSVLVPGASLGRLSWELARLGLSVQGVESSYLQLFMCNFVLNGKATPEKPLHLYPFAHHTGMIRSIDEQLKEVEFPDANPRVLEGAHFTMVAGEFVDLYEEEERWDAVATCFSIENSHSIITCIRRIAKILKIGAVWVNHGCLDFKYDDSLTEPSVEITKEELDLVIARCGLRVIRREKLRCRPPYVVNGMISEEYESYLTVAVRV